MEFENEKEQSSNKTEMGRFVSEIEENDITIENHRRYFEKVKNYNDTVKMQIENIMIDYKELDARFNSLKNRTSFKDMRENGFIPREMHEISQSMFRLLKEAYNWKSLQTRMLFIIFTKSFNLLQDVRALDIKRDSLNEMREMVERQNQLFSERQDSLLNLFKDVIIHKLNASEEKFMILLDQNQKSSKEVLNLLIPLIIKSEMPEENKKRMVGELNRIDKDANPKFDLSFKKDTERSNKPVIPEIPISEPIKRKKIENDNIADIEQDFADFDGEL